ncbi:hypothetical protein JL101_030655 (plasmid) [Skermanella rosea]|uniref:hypothetical protein n=1 Tax=Skermanella rosea TaxID=1817965 RepID=UPI0019333D57|nr:hypothetical protein [Skermanella rosea]UEM06851.1 hypothetical protein JL101_030655 [Skermanella rosea]
MADENRTEDKNQPAGGKPDAGKTDGSNQKGGQVNQEVQEEAAEERKEGGYQ